VLQAVLSEIFSGFPLSGHFNSRTAWLTTSKVTTASSHILSSWLFSNIFPSQATADDNFITTASSNLSSVVTVIQKSAFYYMNFDRVSADLREIVETGRNRGGGGKADGIIFQQLGFHKIHTA
jgi:hypothetical protein